MEHIPNEILTEILSYLSVKCLTRIRLVSKQWLTCVDRLKIKELVLNTYECSELRNWYQSNRRPDEENIVNKFDFRTFHLIPLNLTRLKRLRLEESLIDYDSELKLYFDFRLLNNLVQLEHLELPEIQYDCELSLVLPNLKILTIFRCETDLQIDSPKLEILNCRYDLGSIKFKDPLTIKQLETCDHNQKFKFFKNVTIFRTSNFYCINKQLIKDLINLEQLILVEDLNIGKFYAFLYDEIEYIIDSIMNEMRRLNKMNLKIIFFDYLLDTTKSLSELDVKAKYSHLFED